MLWPAVAAPLRFASSAPSKIWLPKALRLCHVISERAFHPLANLNSVPARHEDDIESIRAPITGRDITMVAPRISNIADRRCLWSLSPHLHSFPLGFCARKIILTTFAYPMALTIQELTFHLVM